MSLVENVTCFVGNVSLTPLKGVVHVVLLVIHQYLDRKSSLCQRTKSECHLVYYVNIVSACNRKEYQLLKQVQHYCLNFFMELVSQCCFPSKIVPEKPSDEFYKKLLDIVTDTEHEDYSDLFPIEEEYTHGCPIARSVLLQLLLEHKYVTVKNLAANMFNQL